MHPPWRLWEAPSRLSRRRQIETPRPAQDVVDLEDDSDETSTPASTFKDEVESGGAKADEPASRPRSAAQGGTAECVPNGQRPDRDCRRFRRADDSHPGEGLRGGSGPSEGASDARVRGVYDDRVRMAKSCAGVPAVVGRRNGDVRVRCRPSCDGPPERRLGLRMELCQAGPQHRRGHHSDHDPGGYAVSPSVRGPRPDDVLRGGIQVSQPDPRVVPSPRFPD
ncbi:hypothetical protein ON010_g5090 [Phytophthora cinnamomi]|nr:hypothetical protein ON010_g5090 [Phytophthora cinnamomi]